MQTQHAAILVSSRSIQAGRKLMDKILRYMLILGALFLMVAGLNAQTQPPPAAPGASTPSGDPAQPQGRKKGVAIFDFDYATVQSSTTALFGTNVDVGKGISDLLVKYLVQDGTYSV